MERYVNVLLPEELRLSPDSRPARPRPAAIRFLLPDHAGIPIDLSIPDADRDSLISSGLLRGHKRATPPLTNDDRAAYLMVGAPDPEAAWEKANDSRRAAGSPAKDERMVDEASGRLMILGVGPGSTIALSRSELRCLSFIVGAAPLMP